MSEFFSKMPSQDLLIKLLEKKDYPSILSYAKPLNPKTSVTKLLNLFQASDAHDNEFCLYMAIIIAKLKSKDLIEALDEYITDVTTVGERRDLFFWKIKNLGVIADIFERELNKYANLLQFMYRVPKDNRSKYFTLKISSHSESNISPYLESKVQETLPLLQKETDQKSIFNKRILVISPNDDEAYKYARNMAQKLSSYTVELKPELIKLIGNPLLAIRMIGEMAQKYQPLTLIYQNFLSIDHEDIDTIFLEQTTQDLLQKKVQQDTYFIALSQNPVGIFRETFENRWFQKAIFLPPSSPDIRKEFFRRNPLTNNFNIDFLAAKSCFYAESEIKHLLNQLAKPQLEYIVKVFEESQPRYSQWLLDVGFLRTWSYYPIWKEISDYTEQEDNFKKESSENLKGEFLEDRLALKEIEENPLSVLSESSSPLLRFKQCRKDHSIPSDISKRLFDLMEKAQPQLDQEKMKLIHQKIFQFLALNSDPSNVQRDFMDKAFSWSLKDSKFAIDLLSTQHVLSSDKLQQLAAKFHTEDVERKIIYYIQRNQVHDANLFYNLAVTFQTANSKQQAIRSLRNEVSREKKTEDLEKLFSLLLVDFKKSSINKKLWLETAEDFNAVNTDKNFSEILSLSKKSREIYHLKPDVLFGLMTDVMCDPELQVESSANEWILDMLKGSQPEESWTKDIDRFKNQATLMIHNKRIGENQRVQFLRNLMNWQVDEKFGLASWRMKLVSGIDFTKGGWSDIKREAPPMPPEAKVSSPSEKLTHSQKADTQQDLLAAKIQLQVEKLKQDIAEVMTGSLPLTEKLKRIEELQATFNDLLKGS